MIIRSKTDSKFDASDKECSTASCKNHGNWFVSMVEEGELVLYVHCDLHALNFRAAKNTPYA